LQRGMHAKRGALIVFEGCDKSGKSTQAQILVERLNSDGIVSRLQRFPDRTTTIGRVIDEYLRGTCELSDQTIHLLFSANRWELSKQMETQLNEGVTLIVDRYAFSGVAFTAAKGIDLEWCRQPDVGLLKPDSVFYLHCNSTVAASRGGYGTERYENNEMQTKVANMYERLMDDTWIKIESSRGIDEIQKEVVTLAKDIIAKCQNVEIGSLWTCKKIMSPIKN